MKIVVVGTGYVGLVTGACLSEVGIEVICIDVNKTKIENLQKGILPIYEPGLEDIVERNYKNGRLQFSTDLAESIVGAEVVFIAVGTPPGEDGSADLQYVLQVADNVGTHMTDYLVVVTKSTVPVGTAAKVKEAIAGALRNRSASLEYDVASNPEFLKEGAAIEDFLKPDRIVIGVESERAKSTLHQLYDPFVLNGHPIYFMDIPSAEMTKYAANAMLATKISFMNDIANLCDIVGANVNEVRKGIGSDARIGNKFIYPGIGYGGSCFPKDVKALIKTGEQNSYELRILKAVDDVNNDQKKVIISKIMKHYNGDVAGKTFAVWGLAFKPKTDDMREAPSLVIIDALLQAGANVQAYDPVSMNEAEHMLDAKVVLTKDAINATKGADALILVTEWPEFRLPNWEKIKSNMKDHVIFDGRNIYNGDEMKAKGFAYHGIGIKS
ncbi:UDP-glucose/GDP-mannose dehydrogenase family protein [Panacibacter sp. DH6]|uniref:UDP-glucose 6-dehydrogenase n=1 Tax=Panacibacter microcysteis TaxID=2793269 RepID=A0A931E4F6_9BACT|nr:UDP-glucose/GDP-mannose dehydrogenase family protein [Panacibacter microcysteis]MBG9374974.1 UDP-glucose/GDP-mannose dehydrogenase family protein [Panacibacter microcysteis]